MAALIATRSEMLARRSRVATARRGHCSADPERRCSPSSAGKGVQAGEKHAELERLAAAARLALGQLAAEQEDQAELNDARHQAAAMLAAAKARAAELARQRRQQVRGALDAAAQREVTADALLTSSRRSAGGSGDGHDCYRAAPVLQEPGAH